MPDPSKLPSLITQIVGGTILLMMGWMISTMGDRYRASEAERDFKQVRAEILAAETRMRERQVDHAVGGPHDDVKERITVLETRFEIILGELREIKLYVRDQDNNK